MLVPKLFDRARLPVKEDFRVKLQTSVQASGVGHRGLEPEHVADVIQADAAVVVKVLGQAVVVVTGAAVVVAAVAVVARALVLFLKL